MPLPRGLALLLRPITDRLVATVDVGDPWERFAHALEPDAFGVGSRHPFAWYFEGKSTVLVESPTAVADWLHGCTYMPDDLLFHESDYWQHPLTFEQLRRGDCEDYALWSWRKLAELGYPAELMVGVASGESESDRGHAWVVFTDDGARYLVDGAQGDRARLVRPLDEVRSQYVPHAGVDAEFTTFCYHGSAHTARARARSRNAP